VFLFISFLFLLFSAKITFAATPEGNIDNVQVLSNNQLEISGWARDPDHPNSAISVHFYLDGAAGYGLYSGSVTANKNRNDVGSHGFTTIISLSREFQFGYHSIFVHGLDLDGENNSLISPTNGKTFFNGSEDLLAQNFNNLPCTPSTSANLTINGQIPGINIQIGTNSLMAGAIASLKLNNLETVNVNDHGRELQYAYQIDGTGEGKNPTEAGASADRTNSSSVFLGGCTNGSNTLYTKTKMAYWYLWNNQKTSPYIMEKIVQIGIPNQSNVIKFLGKFNMAENVQSLIMEIPTGYHIHAFNNLTIMKLSDFSVYTPTENQFWHYLVFNKIFGTQDIMILCNSTLCMAPYSPNTVRYSYWLSDSANIVKWSISKSTSAFSAGTNIYSESYLVIDTPQNIRESIIKLINSFEISNTPTPTRLPTITPTKTNTPTPTPTMIPTISPSLCTQCPNLPLAKSKADADCSGTTTLNDISVWRSEFISSNLGILNKNNWRSDYNCDGKTNLIDASIWRVNFIRSL